jgi:hypothetical protein
VPARHGTAIGTQNSYILEVSKSLECAIFKDVAAATDTDLNASSSSML